MRPRRLGLILVAWSALLTPTLALAQTIRLSEKVEPRPSHRPIHGGLADDPSPEKRLANRLRKGQLDDDMKDLAKKLLEDKDLVESLRKNLKPEDIDRFRQRVGDGKGWADDPALRKLIEEGMKNQTLTDRDRELIQRWHQKNIEKGITPPVMPPGHQPPPPIQVDPNRPTVPPQQPPVQPGQTPPGTATPASVDRPSQNVPDWMKKDLDRAARDFSKWLDTPAGKSMRDRFADAAKRFATSRTNAPPIGDRMRGVGKYLPRPGNFMIDKAAPPTPRIGSLPRMPSPSAMPRVSASGAGKTVLVLAITALVLLIAWKSRGWWADALASRLLGKSWKLGPWPVRPDQVTTRADLVRAFEYLALLNLGPAARAHHHLDLGREIGERPSLDPDRRRDAARTLARLYEQARYTPDDETLSPQDMAAARLELGYLAGEMAA